MWCGDMETTLRQGIFTGWVLCNRIMNCLLELQVSHIAFTSNSFQNSTWWPFIVRSLHSQLKPSHIYSRPKAFASNIP